MVRPLVDADKKAIGITISLPPSSIRLMDGSRGQKSRSAYINNLIEEQGASQYLTKRFQKLR